MAVDPQVRRLAREIVDIRRQLAARNTPQLEHSSVEIATDDGETTQTVTVPELVGTAQGAAAEVVRVNEALEAARTELQEADAELSRRLGTAEAELGEAEQRLADAEAAVADAIEVANTAEGTAQQASTTAASAQEAADAARAEAERAWASASGYTNTFETVGGIDYTPGGSVAPEVVASSDGPYGRVLRKSGDTMGWWRDGNGRMRVRPGTLYRVRFRVRVVTDATSGGGRLYAGVTGYKEDGTPVSISGVASTSSAHYFAAAGVWMTAADRWVTFTGYFAGWGEPAGGVHSDPNDPGVLHPAAVLVEPTVILDYTEGNGVWEVAEWVVESIPIEIQQATAAVPRIIHSTATPSGSAPANSTWFRHSGSLSGHVIGQWTQTASPAGSTWEASQLDSQVIANLDVGKLTAGSAVLIEAVAQKIAAATASFQTVDAKNLFVTGTSTVNEQVANKIWTAKLVAGKVLANEVLIGRGPNMIPWDPETTVAPHMGAGGCQIRNINDPDLGWVIVGDPGGNPADGTMQMFMRLSSGVTARNGRTNSFDVDPGMPYRLRVGIGVGGSMPSGVVRRVQAYYLFYGMNGTVAGIVRSPSVPADTYGADIPYIEHLVTAPAGAVSVDVYLEKNWWSSGSVFVANPTLTSGVDSSLVVDGTITGDKIAGNAIDGKIITGATIRTAVTGIRMVLAATASGASPGVWLYDAADVYRWTTQIVGGVPATHFRDSASTIRLAMSEAGVRFYNPSGGQTMRITPSYMSVWNPADNLALLEIGTSNNNNTSAGLWLYGSGASGHNVVFSISPTSNSDEYMIRINGADTGNRLAQIHRTPGDPGLEIWGGADSSGRGWARLDVMATTDGPRFRSTATQSRTTSAGANVFVGSDGTIARSTSVKAGKLDVADQPMNKDLLKVPFRSWTDKQAQIDAVLGVTETPKHRSVGAIAEEVERVAPELCTYDPDGTLTGVAYDRVGVALLPILRDLTNRVETLEGRPPTIWPESPTYDDSVLWDEVLSYGFADQVPPAPTAPDETPGPAQNPDASAGLEDPHPDS